MLMICAIIAMVLTGAIEAGANIIEVTSFGAVPNDAGDDTAAVLAAMAECRKKGTSVLAFPKGRYRFSGELSPKASIAVFVFDGFDGLTIDGRGSEFIFSGTKSAFWFGNCRDLTLRNFTLDWEPAPFSLGEVITQGGNHFDVQVFPEYPVKGGEPVGAFMDYDPVTHLPLRHGLDEYYTVEHTELVAKQVLRVHLKHPSSISPGVLVLLRHQVYGPSAFICSRCTNVRVLDVTVHTVPGMGFIGSVCKDITLQRFNVLPRPGSGRLMSATADATHFAGCKGTITIEDCRFERMGDDAVNVKSGLYLSMRSRVDNRTIIGQHNLKHIDAPDPGDLMEISHVDDLLPYATLRVKSVEILHDEKQMKVRFEEPLPRELKEGDVFGNATRTPIVRIRNCRVWANRARGMLIQTRGALVEGCRFKDCTGPGILVLTEVAHFFESIGTRDVTIRNNLFEHCNYGAAIGPGVLCSMAYLANLSHPPKPGVHKNVLFEGNTIRETDNCGIFVEGTDGITIRRNRIEGACDAPTSETGSAAIHIRSSRNIRLEDNLIDPTRQGKGFKTAVEYGEGTEQNAAPGRPEHR